MFRPSITQMKGGREGRRKKWGKQRNKPGYIYMPALLPAQSHLSQR